MKAADIMFVPFVFWKLIEVDSLLRNRSFHLMKSRLYDSSNTCVRIKMTTQELLGVQYDK